MKRGKNDLNADLLRRASDAFAGPSLGTFMLPEGDDFVVAHARGARVYDMNGKEYVDYVMGSGPMILGHAHPSVVAAIVERATHGSTYYALNEPAVLLAEKIIAASPCAEALKFCGSGSDATAYALRIARASTGRDKVLKFEGAYHGVHDYAMLSTTPTQPGKFPTAIPDSAGIPAGVQKDVLIAPFNDLAETLKIMEASRNELAAVIVEPQSRLVEPVPGFLEGLREATRRMGIVLIFDEVVTGFRLAWGGAQERYGVTPDLATYGKIIGGGLPLGAVAGSKELIALTDVRKKSDAKYAYVSGTLNGNPLSAAAGLATLRELEKPGTYDRLEALGERMRAGLTDVARQIGIPAQVLGRGPLANIYLTPHPVVDYRSSIQIDRKTTVELNRELLRRGFMCLMGKLYITLAHTNEDIDRTVAAVDDSLKSIVGGNAAKAANM